MPVNPNSTLPPTGGNAGPAKIVVAVVDVVLDVVVEVDEVLVVLVVEVDVLVVVVVSGGKQVPSWVGFVALKSVAPLFETCTSPGAKSIV